MTGPPHSSLGSLGSLGSISIPSLPSFPSSNSPMPPAHPDSLTHVQDQSGMGPAYNGGMASGQNGYQQQMPAMRSEMKHTHTHSLTHSLTCIQGPYSTCTSLYA